MLAQYLNAQNEEKFIVALLMVVSLVTEHSKQHILLIFYMQLELSQLGPASTDLSSDLIQFEQGDLFLTFLTSWLLSLEMGCMYNCSHKDPVLLCKGWTLIKITRQALFGSFTSFCLLVHHIVCMLTQSEESLLSSLLLPPVKLLTFLLHPSKILSDFSNISWQMKASRRPYFFLSKIVFFVWKFNVLTICKINCTCINYTETWFGWSIFY